MNQLSQFTFAKDVSMLDKSNMDDDLWLKVFLLIMGLGMLVVGILWLGFNEQRFFITSQRIHNAEEQCVTINANSDQNLQLVHLIGETKTLIAIWDPIFDIQEINTIRMERQVEMYQWIETERRLDNDDYSDPYLYSKEWSSSFQVVKGSREYMNHEHLWTVENMNFINPQVHIQAYELSFSLKKQTLAKQIIYITQDQLNHFKRDSCYTKWHPIIFQEEEYVYLQQSEELKTGDLRIRYQKAPCGQHTVISQLVGDTFKPYMIHDEYERLLKEQGNEGPDVTRNPINEIDWIFDGSLSKSQAFLQKLWAEMKIFWKLRIKAMGLITAALFCFWFHPGFRQWITISDRIISQFGWLSYALALSAQSISLSSITISLVWIYYKPLRGFILLMISLFITFLVSLMFNFKWYKI